MLALHFFVHVVLLTAEPPSTSESFPYRVAMRENPSGQREYDRSRVKCVHTDKHRLDVSGYACDHFDRRLSVLNPRWMRVNRVVLKAISGTGDSMWTPDHVPEAIWNEGRVGDMAHSFDTDSEASGLCAFVDASPSPFHACSEAGARLSGGRVRPLAGGRAFSAR